MKTFPLILISGEHMRLEKSSKAVKDDELEEEKLILREMGKNFLLV